MTTKQHELLRTAFTHDERLDDITRARMWTQLEDRMTTPAAPRRWPIIAGAVLAAAAAVVAFVATRPGRSDDAPALIAPRDTTLVANLGPYTRAALVGDRGEARLELVGAPGEITRVRLAHGTLLASFDGGAGRALAIETRDATIEVVGTLFAVDVDERETCIAVAHGKVRVVAAGRESFVAGGERLCTQATAVQPIPPAIRDTLAQHERVIARVEPPPAQPPANEPPQSDPPQRTPAAPPTVTVTVPARTHASAPHDTRQVPTIATITRIPAVTPTPSPSTSPPTPPPSQTTTTTPTPPSTPPIDPPVPPVTAPHRATPDELYRTAEQALAAHRPGDADRALDQLVREYPSSSLVDQALYERARIAYRARAWATARRHLDQLAQLAAAHPSPLAEPGRYLTCRIAVEARDGEAASCLAAYRAAYPHAPHDLEALALIVQLAHARGGCAQARPFVDELEASYPRADLASAWRARCPKETR
ncbi:MAG TPA: FecR family protein [Kofleriaceae bacterium]|nr:FecR family protein [Kofleriaceae bacterium]